MESQCFSNPKSQNHVYWKKNLSPGYRFHPSDAQLIVHYLNPKIKNQTPPLSPIIEVDNVYGFNPEKIADDYGVNRAEEAFFFTRRYIDESIKKRPAVGGCWRPRGYDEIVQQKGKTLGLRRTFRFYPLGDGGSGAYWIMQEIRAIKDDTMLDDWIVCRVYNYRNIWEHVTVEELDDEMYGESDEDCY